MEASTPTLQAPLKPMVADEPYCSPLLISARREAQRRRAAAMVATHDTILSFRFHPLTPASYSRLILIESPFLWQRNPAPSAVRDYLWNHWPQFDEAGEGRNAFLRAIERRICPPWLSWGFTRDAWEQRRAKGYVVASAQISELVAVAFADLPAPGDGTRRICASLEAQMIELFAARYRWVPERTRTTPLRQLYQFIRCNDSSDYAAEDAAIIAADLRRENEAAIAARAITA